MKLENSTEVTKGLGLDTQLAKDLRFFAKEAMRAEAELGQALEKANLQVSLALTGLSALFVLLVLAIKW